MIFDLLSKLGPLFIFPVGLIMVGLLLALYLQGYKRLQGGVLGLTALVLFLSSNTLTSHWLLYSLESRYPPLENDLDADVIILLSGGEEPRQFPRQIPEVNGAGDRIIYAGYLLQEGAAPKMIISGGNLPWENQQTNAAQETRKLLNILGISQEDLILETQSRNTYENARASARIARDHQFSEIILVTSALHMPRAVAAFQKQDLDVIPAPVDFQVTGEGLSSISKWSWQTWMIQMVPNVEHLSLTTRALREYLGLFIYRLRGWI